MPRGGNARAISRGYRNSSYTRDLVTPTGRIEDLKVPRDRAGDFHIQVFERYDRYEPEVAEARHHAECCVLKTRELTRQRCNGNLSPLHRAFQKPDCDEDL